MKFTSRIGGGLRALLRRNQVESELDDELHEFLQRTIERNISRGMGIEEATRAARIEIGGFDVVKEQVRDVGWESRVAAFWLDTRYAMRTLLRAKGLTVTVVVTLALGIGANAAIFSVVRGVLLRPLVNRDEDRLIYIRQTAPGIGSENMTFSVPEIKDFRSRATALSAFGEFSTVDFTVIGLGPEPRVVKAGVVNGSFFDVMGLRPVLGRLLNPQDDGTEAASVVVLTHRFWTTQFNSDPAVIGRTLRVASRTATVVGVLEPSVPYPTETEIMANMVTSPHHIGATMQSIRTHRMTELFGRLAPGATLESARTELGALHADILHEHPEAYSAGNVELRVTRLRDQIAGPARPVLLVLLAAAVVVFVIACSNVANLILARSVRRERELAVRAALGAGRRALRRTLLAESLVLCSAGAVLGVLLAQPFVALFARYAARFSIRALDVTVDASAVCVGAGLAGCGCVACLRSTSALDECPGRARTRDRRDAHHRERQPEAAGLRDEPDCMLVRAARRRGNSRRHTRHSADREDRLQHPERAGVRHPDAGAGRQERCSQRLPPADNSTRRRTTRRRRRRSRRIHAVARCRELARTANHRRGLHARGRRRNVRAAAICHAKLLRPARCSPARRP
jgi:MacB-like periplasmic core domain/FtsX-like permease family